MTRRPVLLAGLCLCLAASPGCQSWFMSEKWERMAEEYDVEELVLWEAIREALAEEFDTLELERTGKGVLRTGWRNSLSIMPGRGNREQAHVRVTRGERGYVVNVRVAREVNEEPIYTLDPRRARWVPAEDNSGGAAHLVGLIDIKLRAAIGR